MNTLIVYPENKEQLNAVKAVMKAMKISFEQKSEDYPTEIINGVKKSLKESEKGQLKSYTSIKDMLNLA